VALLAIPTDRAEWLALRRKHVGASEVAVLFGAAPDYLPGPYALWQIKAGFVEPEDVDNERTRAGLKLEDAIAEMAAEKEGWTIEPGVYGSVHGLGATLDRRIAAPGPSDPACSGPGVLEIKNVDWLVHRRSWGDEPPMHILLQLQAQLAATGYTWGAVAALIGGNHVEVYRYQPRPKLLAEIIRRVRHFWATIEQGTPPAPDGSDATYRALMQLNSAVEEEPADLDTNEEAQRAASAYIAAAAAEKAAEKVRKEARNVLIHALGNHRWGMGGGYQISQAVTDENPGTVITADMVGNRIGARSASRRLSIKEIQA
jgi:putative phage-type endonuclease